jgi:hypothetical protein
VLGIGFIDHVTNNVGFGREPKLPALTIHIEESSINYYNRVYDYSLLSDQTCDTNIKKEERMIEKVGKSSLI